MKKFVEFIKKNYLFITLAILILGVGIFLISRLSKGTFGLEDGSSPIVRLTCPENIYADNDIQCEISVVNPSNNILSVNANYNIPSDITYSSFAFRTSCSDDTCVAVATTNGFAYGLSTGLSEDMVIGNLNLHVSANATAGSEYVIELTNVELSTNTYDMISLNNVSSTVVVAEPIGGITFDEEVDVDYVNNVIRHIDYNTECGELKELISANGELIITDKNDNVMSDDSPIKTGYKLKTVIDDEEVVFSLSVLGDLTGDGNIDLNDVLLSYNIWKGRKQTDDQAVLQAGDLTGDGSVDMNDTFQIYNRYKALKNS